MDVFEYGNPNASLILLQMIGDHDIEMIDHEFDLIQKAVSDELCLIACKVDDWNRDLSPWKAPAVFKSESFGENAAKTLSEVLTYIGEKKQPCIIGGYSLAGLFALWAATKTDRFSKVAAASPSVWFPGFTEYIKENNIKAKAVYLSLGKRSAKDRQELRTWTFYQFEQDLTYKAQAIGSQVLKVKPDYTSQRCPKCGRIQKGNRHHDIHEYICDCCGYRSNDDRVGAMNIQILGTMYVSGDSNPRFGVRKVN